jgi:hypothetical protein
MFFAWHSHATARQKRKKNEHVRKSYLNKIAHEPDKIIASTNHQVNNIKYNSTSVPLNSLTPQAVCFLVVCPVLASAIASSSVSDGVDLKRLQ